MRRDSRVFEILTAIEFLTFVFGGGNLYAQGDDPKLLAQLDALFPPKSIQSFKDEKGDRYVSGISIPDNREALQILPQLHRFSRLTTLRIAFKGLKDDDLKQLSKLSSYGCLRQTLPS